MEAQARKVVDRRIARRNVSAKVVVQGTGSWGILIWVGLIYTEACSACPAGAA